MLLVTTIAAILQSFAISLGVGSSTLAITNFFAAIADGTIDETERRMMGIVYVVLRIAMIAILFTTAIIAIPTIITAGIAALTTIQFAQSLIIFVLFANALLMTMHVVPSTIGPGIQAGSWYALGTLIALQAQDITQFSFVHFGLAYASWLVLAVGIVNGVMAVLKAAKQRNTVA